MYIQLKKILIESSREFSPNTEWIGFQHSVWFKEQLGMFLIKNDLASHPLPDKVITSGIKYVYILNEVGFPKGIIHSGQI